MTRIYVSCWDGIIRVSQILEMGHASPVYAHWSTFRSDPAPQGSTLQRADFLCDLDGWLHLQAAFRTTSKNGVLDDRDFHVCRYVSRGPWPVGSFKVRTVQSVQLFNAHHTLQGACISYSQSDTPGDMAPPPTRVYRNSRAAAVLLFKTITGSPSIRFTAYCIGWELTDNSYIGPGGSLLVDRLLKWLM